ncbi:DUF4269 domain-containing protein [Robertkochia aurantiaca]|uniref:DUF4269 domain-containing protein n=1 Tax=Robertkochia aurantiaca TaxID=2873700 RepID=UPI001CCD3B01|nr:DUF4269 domain-containing protein [Robertkochia sp. 3YJGBD-33]
MWQSEPTDRMRWLADGCKQQKKAWLLLRELGLLSYLKPFQATVAGTYPLGLITSLSDLDILCEVRDHVSFRKHVVTRYGVLSKFRLKQRFKEGLLATIIRFEYHGMEMEIFGQHKKVEQQTAYLHMLAEEVLLRKHDWRFREKIMELKLQGLSTEEAFARELGLTGDPYQALLRINPD